MQGTCPEDFLSADLCQFFIVLAALAGAAQTQRQKCQRNQQQHNAAQDDAESDFFVLLARRQQRFFNVLGFLGNSQRCFRGGAAVANYARCRSQAVRVKNGLAPLKYASPHVDCGLESLHQRLLLFVISGQHCHRFNGLVSASHGGIPFCNELFFTSQQITPLAGLCPIDQAAYVLQAFHDLPGVFYRLNLLAKGRAHIQGDGTDQEQNAQGQGNARQQKAFDGCGFFKDHWGRPSGLSCSAKPDAEAEAQPMAVWTWCDTMTDLQACLCALAHTRVRQAANWRVGLAT